MSSYVLSVHYLVLQESRLSIRIKQIRTRCRFIESIIFKISTTLSIPYWQLNSKDYFSHYRAIGTAGLCVQATLFGTSNLKMYQFFIRMGHFFHSLFSRYRSRMAVSVRSLLDVLTNNLNQIYSNPVNEVYKVIAVFKNCTNFLKYVITDYSKNNVLSPKCSTKNYCIKCSV